MVLGERQRTRTTGQEDRTKPPVVLVVEDERGLADLYTAILEDTYTVRTAYTGEQALDLLDDAVDVALIDRRLEDWSGDQLVTAIHDRNIDCQVAMVTAVAPDFDIVDLAIDDYLTKPVSREELLEKVEELLLWTRSDINKQELLALVSKKITLENEKTQAELEASTEYSKLGRWIELSKDRLDLDLEQMPSGERRPDACPRCDLRWDVSVGDATGFLEIGAYVWKCTMCGNIDEAPDPTNRRVNRR